MFYREAGQFKTRYGTDQAIFPIAQDRYHAQGRVELRQVGHRPESVLRVPQQVASEHNQVGLQ